MFEFGVLGFGSAVGLVAEPGRIARCPQYEKDLPPDIPLERET